MGRASGVLGPPKPMVLTVPAEPLLAYLHLVYLQEQGDIMLIMGKIMLYLGYKIKCHIFGKAGGGESAAS